MKASKTTRKWMKLTYCLLIFIAVSLLFFLGFLSNLMRDIHLMSSGIVTRATIVSVGRCVVDGGDYGSSTSSTYDLQFVDNKGQTRVENVSRCDNPFWGDWSVGDSISILYAPNDPTVIAEQDLIADEFQSDEVIAVFFGVITIGMALAILLIQLIRSLMILRERGLSQGNCLLAFVSKNEVVARFLNRNLCRGGIHQGEWAKTGCQLSRYCIFCGKPQHREVHNWPWPPRAMGLYLKDGSCEQWVKCLDCEETKSIGENHLSKTSWWKSKCMRCGKDL